MDSEERNTNKKTKRRYNKGSPHPFQNLKDEITLRKEGQPCQEGASYQQQQTRRFLKEYLKRDLLSKIVLAATKNGINEDKEYVRRLQATQKKEKVPTKIPRPSWLRKLEILWMIGYFKPNESYFNLKKELEKMTPKQAHSFYTDFQLETTEKINFITNYIASRRKMKSEALRLLKLEQQQEGYRHCLEGNEGEANKMPECGEFSAIPLPHQHQ
ncbi:hypothetical protein Pcinc_032427 [Petrolisthes cinctipes]|uniref:Uncharacterized protein n=1 Tax=Petrolisthes cinctipes TaxID=88211 RepID=A0AAE1EU50_PETCI|nr:hypothetical protein Pcinc_032427 [Petrolisthes cinctipes]